MIGTALSEKEQMDILNKLDKTDVPWNCAHGRVSLELLNHLKILPVDISLTLIHMYPVHYLPADNEPHQKLD